MIGTLITKEEYINWWNSKTEKMLTPDDVPSLDNISEGSFCDKETWETAVVPALLRTGAISINDLKIGHKYLGSCRNTSEAIWTGKEFEYKRYKWGSCYIDTIKHFQDDDGFDLFVPIKDLTIEGA